MATLGGYTIYVSGEEELAPVTIPVLEVLDATESTAQYFNTPSRRLRIVGRVFKTTNHDSINSLRGSSGVAYVNDVGSQGNWLILSISWSRQRGTPLGISGVSSTDAHWIATIDMVKTT